MKKFFPLLCLMVMTLSSPRVMADDDVRQVVEGLAGFENIVSNSSFDVEFRQGNAQQVIIKADSRRDISAVKVTVKDNTLYIECSEGVRWTDDVELKITAPHLYSVVANASGDIEVEQLNTSHFTATVTGTGDIELNGTCESATFSNNGRGDIEADDFAVGKLSVTVNSTGDIDCRCTDTLDATVNGRGKVEYSGHPRAVNCSGRTGAIRPDR